MEKYSYKPLSSPLSTRIILLHPATDRNATLRCGLSEIDLEWTDKPPRVFHALSYVWGAKEGSRTLLCEEKSIPITANCESALRHLRDVEKVVPLWVDAVSIDHQDATERAAQVKLMSLIYRSARQVVIWLGEGTEATAKCFAHMRKLHGLGLNWEEFHEESLKLISNMSVRELFHVWCNPWSSRIWTVQEFALASEPVVMCGDCVVPWTSYHEFSAPVQAYCAAHHPECISRMQMGFLQLVNRTISTIYASQVPARFPESMRCYVLAYATEISQSNDSTNSLDKVYGFYGLLSDFMDDLPTVDYSINELDLYQSFTLATIKSTRRFWPAVLIRQTENKVPNLPSWVPDFGYQHRNEDPTGPRQILPNTMVMNATCNSSLDLATLKLSGNGAIALKGEALTTAAAIAETWPKSSLTGDSVDRSISCLGDWAVFTLCIVSSRGSPGLLFDFVNILLWTESLDEKERIQSLTRSLLQWMAEAPKRPDSDSIGHWFAKCYSNPDAMKFVHSLHSVAPGSTLFVTESGRLARTYGAIEKSDTIALLAGCEYPVVLRREGDNWCYIGSAYVAGIMNGEEWPQNKSTGDMETFVLV